MTGILHRMHKDFTTYEDALAFSKQLAKASNTMSEIMPGINGQGWVVEWNEWKKGVKWPD